MKHTLIFGIGLLLIMGCKKDLDCGDCYVDLTSDHLKKYIPVSSFENYSKALFINNRFEELIFDVSVEETTIPISTSIGSNHHHYTTTFLRCDYEHLNNSNYSMRIETNVYYFYAPDVISYVKFGIASNNSFLGSFRTSNNPGFDEEARVLPGTELSHQLKINGRSFNNVYSKIAVSDLTIKMQEIYYNAEYGIIGFRDDLNVLWSFKEFKN